LAEGRSHLYESESQGGGRAGGLAGATRVGRAGRGHRLSTLLARLPTDPFLILPTGFRRIRTEAGRQTDGRNGRTEGPGTNVWRIIAWTRWTGALRLL